MARTTSMGDRGRTAETSRPPSGPAIAGSRSRARGGGAAGIRAIARREAASLPLVGRHSHVVGGLAADGVEVRLHVHLLDAVPVADVLRVLERVLAVEGADVVRVHFVDEDARAGRLGAGADAADLVLLPREMQDVAL